MFSKLFFRSAVALTILASCGRTWSAEDQAEADKPHGEAAAHAGGHGGGHIGITGVSDDPGELKTDLAIYTFVVFLALLALLYRFAWGPVSEGLERREAGIHDNIAAAEAARIKAEKMLAEHAAKLDKVQDEVHEILAEARRDAEHTKNDIVAAAQKEAEASRQRAVTDIERARDQAMDELFAYMARSVSLATEQVIGRSLTGPDNDRLIEEALNTFAQRKH
ncbi:MAG TPA: F0F1 ATP synthase subunit B [Planctomycetaceae bacterium]